MGCLGNIIWFLCGGLWQGLGWTLAGVLWCVTIIGIPIGTQCFKFASLAFFPFGRKSAMAAVPYPCWQTFMAGAERDSAGHCRHRKRHPPVLYRHRNSFRTAVLQDRQACSDAIWSHGGLGFPMLTVTAARLPTVSGYNKAAESFSCRPVLVSMTSAYP